MEKVMPLFDFLQYTTLNKVKVMRRLFEELDEESKMKNLTLNQNIVKQFNKHSDQTQKELEEK
jgi:hypothetical protein